MPGMTLFIVRSTAEGQDASPCIDSFTGVTDIIHVSSLDEINAVSKLTDWYAVMYDNERVDERLNAGLEVFVEQCSADVLILLKLDQKVIWRSPRLFRSHVALEPGSLLPANRSGLVFETVLNGWILPND